MTDCIVCQGCRFDYRKSIAFEALCEPHREEVIAKRVAQRKKISDGATRRWAEVRRTPAQTDWRNWAIRSVARAVRNGWLPDLSTGEYACVDCNGVADRWEHRDYALVLDVEPVCHGCNMRRGPGQMPVITRTFAKLDPSQRAGGESESTLSNRAA